MPKISVRHLHQVPELLPDVAHWIFKAFWEEEGHSDSRFLEVMLKEAKSPDEVPLSWVAFWDDEPVGTVNLIENDDEERTHLRPWLAALWVAPAVRKQGIGSKLVEEVLKEAKRLKIERVYLETHSPKFYQDLGAVLIEEIRVGFFLMAFCIRQELSEP